MAVVAAIVFDMDGVLIDSEETWSRVRGEVVAWHGGHWTEADQRNVMGDNSRQWSAYIKRTWDVPLSADEIFRDLLVPNDPKPETKHPDMLPSVQHLHGELVALRDPADQDFVRYGCRAQWPSRRFGRMEWAGGSIAAARFFGLAPNATRICDLPHTYENSTCIR